MRRLAVVGTAVLLAASSLAAPQAEARWRGGGIAAGVIGGIAAASLIGAASGAYAAPAYGYGSGWGYAYDPYVYRPARRYVYGYEPRYTRVRVVPRHRHVYRTPRVVRSYAYDPGYYAPSYAYGPAYGWGAPAVSVAFGFGRPWGYGRPYWGW
jgi:hypothetical protein